MTLFSLAAVLVAVQTGSPVQATPPVLQPAPGNPVVVISTRLGEITLELFRDRAPASVENFLLYSESGFYEGTIFHRVISGFMIQGGGLTADLAEKPTRPPIRNEAANGLQNVRGAIAMARTQALRSATAQFFINLADNRAKLDHRGYTPADFGYAVFGRVISGMDVCDRIAAVQTRAAGAHESVPVEPIVITGVRVVK